MARLFGGSSIISSWRAVYQPSFNNWQENELAGNGDLWSGCVGVKGRVSAESGHRVSTECISGRSSDGTTGERLGNMREPLLNWFSDGDTGDELIWIMPFMIK